MLLRASLISLLVLIIFRIGWAQDGTFVVKVDTDLVTIDVTVTDQQGNYVTGLQKEDFELLEDGQPVPIEVFQTTHKFEDSPLALVFAIDLSGSLSTNETRLSRQSIGEFISRLDRRSLSGLIGFNNQVKVLEGITHNQQKLVKKLQSIKEYGGSTRIYDAVDRAITMLRKAPAYRDNRRLRKVIVVVTDGFDSASVIDKQELVRRAQDAGVTIYSVTLPSYSPQLSSNSNQKRVPTLLDISRITDLTGGKDFTVEADNYREVYNAIAQEIASGYLIAFYPSRNAATAQTHTLQVKLKRDGLTVRASRNSYVK